MLPLTPAPSLEQVEIAARLRVEHHEGVGAVAAQRVQQRDRRLVRPAKVVDDGAGRSRSQRRAVDAEGLERRRAEVVKEPSAGRARVEGRIVQRGEDVLCARVTDLRRRRLRDEHLGRGQPRQLASHQLRLHLRHRELAGADVGVGDGGSPVVEGDGGEVVVGRLVEQLRLDHGARCDDPHDGAVDEAPPVRLADLLADGDAVALLDEPREVGVEGVVGNAGERHLLALPHVPLREDDLQVARGDLRVLVERLVEVAHAEEEQRVGVLRLHAEVLRADGGGHGRIVQPRGAPGPQEARPSRRPLPRPPWRPWPARQIRWRAAGSP